MRSPFTLLVCALLALLPLCAAHICMWEPRQRGDMVVDGFADSTCFRKGPDPCGRVPRGPVLTTLVAGSDMEVQFQQQLNHWSGANPGAMRVQLARVAEPKERDFKEQLGLEIPDWSAFDEGIMTNFSLAVRLPSEPCDPCVLRVHYQSNNPHEVGPDGLTSDFYQCADIRIVKGESGATETPAPKQKQQQPKKQLVEDEQLLSPSKNRSLAAPDTDCWTPVQFESRFDMVSPYDAYNGLGHFSYDGVNKLIFTAMPSLGEDAVLHYQNYSSGIEWIYEAATGRCRALGLGEWHDYGYGSLLNQEHWDTVTVGGQQAHLYINYAADFVFGASVLQRGLCMPLLRQRSRSREMQLFFDTRMGIAEPRIFVPPPVCKLKRAWKISQSANIGAVRAYAATLPRAKPQRAEGQALRAEQRVHSSERITQMEQMLATLRQKHSL